MCWDEICSANIIRLLLNIFKEISLKSTIIGFYSFTNENQLISLSRMDARDV